MVRLTLVLTVMLTVIGLPEALKPVLFQQGPRLVILTTDEEPHILNPMARERVLPPLQPLAAPQQLRTLEIDDGPQLGQYEAYAEALMSRTQS
ncbi:hypothetical protein [Marinobacterium weihaiense]|uniref:Uncharacterized protein n=1 Tax=Marinobacterium weihaiense TaxID=2851016 RepID=A0ABS6MAP7_9GAMM|nr:hypothetical protein [Marinobacterium weihaiense]MBV0933310.1 hypothetical protein [Marinobacterium weihaiense]